MASPKKLRKIFNILCATGIVSAFSVFIGSVAFSQQTNIRPSQTASPYNVQLTSCSIILGSTAPQLLVAQNNTRKFLIFQVQQQGNASVPSIGYSYTSTTPSLGTEDTLTLPPLASGGHESVTVPTNAVWVVGPAGTVITCAQG